MGPLPDQPNTPFSTNDFLVNKPKKKLRIVLASIVVIILVSAAALVWLLHGTKPVNTAEQPLSSSEKLLYEMLGTAATEDTVRFTYAERKFDSPEARQKNIISDDAYSVAELNNATKDFRGVYAARIGTSSSYYYNVGRCLDGKVFSPQILLTIKTLQAATDTLKQSLPELSASSSRQTESCQLAAAPRPARLTDGIIPIGLNEPQTNAWLQYLRTSQFIQTKDEGTTTYRGQPVRKLHITTNSIAGTGSFYDAVRTGAGLQLTLADGKGPGPDAYRLDDIPSLDNIDGFYLIDEDSGLPVYSEFVSASLLNNKGGYVFRQAYGYPETLSLGQTSTIETLE